MKQAYLVDVNLKIRVVLDEDVDPEGQELDDAVFKSVTERIKEEGSSFISEGIDDYEEDTETPYDPEYDD